MCCAVFTLLFEAEWHQCVIERENLHRVSQIRRRCVSTAWNSTRMLYSSVLACIVKFTAAQCLAHFPHMMATATTVDRMTPSSPHVLRTPKCQRTRTFAVTTVFVTAKLSCHYYRRWANNADYITNCIYCFLLTQTTMPSVNNCDQLVGRSRIECAECNCCIRCHYHH